MQAEDYSHCKKIRFAPFGLCGADRSPWDRLPACPEIGHIKCSLPSRRKLQDRLEVYPTTGPIQKSLSPTGKNRLETTETQRSQSGITRFLRSRTPVGRLSSRGSGSFRIGIRSRTGSGWIGGENRDFEFGSSASPTSLLWSG